jgi:hypothetical protein
LALLFTKSINWVDVKFKVFDMIPPKENTHTNGKELL